MRDVPAEVLVVAGRDGGWDVASLHGLSSVVVRAAGSPPPYRVQQRGIAAEDRDPSGMCTTGNDTSPATICPTSESTTRPLTSVTEPAARRRPQATTATARWTTSITTTTSEPVRCASSAPVSPTTISPADTACRIQRSRPGSPRGAGRCRDRPTRSGQGWKSRSSRPRWSRHDHRCASCPGRLFACPTEHRRRNRRTPPGVGRHASGVRRGRCGPHACSASAALISRDVRPRAGAS
jgi:hypothetical protein